MSTTTTNTVTTTTSPTSTTSTTTVPSPPLPPPATAPNDTRITVDEETERTEKEQIDYLEHYYQDKPYPDEEDLKVYADFTNLDVDEVSRWFEERRQQEVEAMMDEVESSPPVLTKEIQGEVAEITDPSEISPHRPQKRLVSSDSPSSNTSPISKRYKPERPDNNENMAQIDNMLKVQKRLQDQLEKETQLKYQFEDKYEATKRKLNIVTEELKEKEQEVRKIPSGDASAEVIEALMARNDELTQEVEDLKYSSGPGPDHHLRRTLDKAQERIRKLEVQLKEQKMAVKAPEVVVRSFGCDTSDIQSPEVSMSSDAAPAEDEPKTTVEEVLQARLKELEEKYAERETQLEDQKKRVVELETLVEKKDQENQKLENGIDEKNDEIQKLTGDLNKWEKGAETEKMRNEIESLKKELEQLQDKENQGFEKEKGPKLIGF